VNLQSKVKTLLARLSKEKHFIAVGDLHGSWQAANATLQLLKDFEIPVIFLGDYCDRGTSTIKTIDSLIASKRKRPDWIFLLGNHELLLLQSQTSGEVMIADPKYLAAYDEYKNIGGIPKTHLGFMKSLVPYHESKSLIFVHGGVEESVDLPIDQVPIEELVWTYDIAPTYKGKKLVRGHQVVDNPLETPTHISLDTGVGYGKTLSLGILDDSPRRKGRRLVGWIEVNPDGEVAKIVQLTS